MKPTAKQYLEQSGYGSGTNFTSGCVVQLMEEYANLLPESEPQKAGMPTEISLNELYKILEVDFGWSFYDEKGKVHITNMQKQLLQDTINAITSRLSVPEVKPISDEALQTYFANHYTRYLSPNTIPVMTRSEAIAMVKHFLNLK